MVLSLRCALEEAWNAKAIDLYGLSELWGSTSWECPVRPDRMHLGESTAYGIAIDKNGKLAPDGKKGEIVLTNYALDLSSHLKI